MYLLLYKQTNLTDGPSGQFYAKKKKNVGRQKSPQIYTYIDSDSEVDDNKIERMTIALNHRLGNQTFEYHFHLIPHLVGVLFV